MLSIQQLLLWAEQNNLDELVHKQVWNGSERWAQLVSKDVAKAGELCVYDFYFIYFLLLNNKYETGKFSYEKENN